MLREARRLVRPGGTVAMEGMLYADIGSGRFWVGRRVPWRAAWAFGPAAQALVDDWRAFYYTYLTRRPDSKEAPR